MWRLDNPIQRYAWGSHHAIARLQGRPAPTAEPEAELWMGAHPSASSRLTDARGPTLASAIERDPEAMLGAAVGRRFGPRLPLLLKVLAAAEPLSLQAHPNAVQAREGFAREQARGIELDSPRRSYRDPYDKPELVCALGPFAALSGFRAVEQTRALIEALAVPSLRACTEPLWTRSEPEGLAAVVGGLLTAPDPAPVVEAVVDACRRQVGRGPSPWRAALAWAVRLGERYPGDPGVIVALLLELVELAPGEALFLGPGRLHCYLEGTAIEIMGSSDNVLRGGLTTKHVDVAELLRVLDFRPQPAEVLRPEPVDDRESRFRTPSEAFALSRVTLAAGQRWTARVEGPEILLCVDGAIEVHDAAGPRLGASAGDSVFVPGTARSYVARTSSGASLFRATVGAVA